MKNRTSVFGILVLLLVTGCTSRIPWPRSGVYSGYYYHGFEKSIFAPIGAKERWWVSGNIENIVTLYRSPSKSELPRTIKPIYLVVRGNLSDEGKYGHLGAYQRELIVKEVVEYKVNQEEIKEL